MTDVTYEPCPLRCGWRQVDRSHLGTVVVVDGRAEDGSPNLVTKSAALSMQDELRAHLASEHRNELLWMVAGIEGGRGAPVTVNLVQHLDARQLRDAADLALTVLVPQMRARLARDLATKRLRPVDPWPAVQVRRYVWANAGDYTQAMMNGDSGQPRGMREMADVELEDGREPDLYQLELSTPAVADTREVTL